MSLGVGEQPLPEGGGFFRDVARAAVALALEQVRPGSQTMRMTLAPRSILVGSTVQPTAAAVTACGASTSFFRIRRAPRPPASMLIDSSW